MCGDEIHPRGASHFAVIIVRADEEERRDSHDFPRHEEDEAVRCHDDAGHARAQQTGEGSDTRLSARVVECVDGRACAEDEDRQKERRGERIDTRCERCAGKVPRRGGRDNGPISKDIHCAGDTENRRHNDDDAAHPFGRSRAHHQRRETAQRQQ